MGTKVNAQNWAELDFLINNFYEIVEYKRGRGIYGDRVILKRSKRPECVFGEKDKYYDRIHHFRSILKTSRFDIYWWRS